MTGELMYRRALAPAVALVALPLDQSFRLQAVDEGHDVTPAAAATGMAGSSGPDEIRPVTLIAPWPRLGPRTALT
jgi:hypothetical protein